MALWCYTAGWCLSISIVCPNVCSDADQRKHQISASLAFVRVIHGDGEFPHKGPVMRKMFPFDDVIISWPWQLDMSMARRRLKSPQSLSGTSAHPTMVTLVNIMVMNGWLTSFSFHVDRPSHSWDKAISDSDLQISTPRSRSWVWSKGKVIQSAQIHINSLHFHFESIRPTIPEIELFPNLTLKHPRSRSWVRSKVKVTSCTKYPTDALPFNFTSIRPIIPEIWPK